MADLKAIKIHSMVYERLKSYMRFNEGFSDCINRVMNENDLILHKLRGFVNEMQELRKKDTAKYPG